MTGRILPHRRPDFGQTEEALQLTPMPRRPLDPRRVRKRRYILYFFLFSFLFSIGSVHVFHEEESGFLRLQRLYERPGLFRTGHRLPSDPALLAHEMNMPLEDVRTAERVIDEFQRRVDLLGPLDWAIRIPMGQWTLLVSYQIFFNMAISAIIASALYIRARDSAASELIDEQNQRLRELNERLETKIEEARRYLRELKETQTQLLAAEKLASIGRLSATLAHEIRNPLSIMKSAIGLSLEDIPEGNPALDALRLVQGEIERLNKIMSDLLDFSRPKPPRLESQLLDQLIPSWVARVDRELRDSKCSFTCVIEPDLPAVIADADQLYQIFLNLVLNARDALQPEGGGEIEVVAERAGERGVFLEIRDDGPGMDEETLAQIYEPFFTTKTHGSGLGLPLVMQLIEGMGGSIYVESTPGAGTTISLFVRSASDRTPSPITAEQLHRRTPREVQVLPTIEH